MNVSVEDYLKAMYSIHEDMDDPSEGLMSKEIASALDVSKPSVSAMMRKLADQRYIKAEPYKRIHFTKKGIEEAKRLMRNHRLIEVFLREKLGCDLKKVHAEAHRLEHAFSQYSMDRLDSFLDSPKKSPYGRIIPR